MFSNRLFAAVVLAIATFSATFAPADMVLNCGCGMSFSRSCGSFDVFIDDGDSSSVLCIEDLSAESQPSSCGGTLFLSLSSPGALDIAIYDMVFVDPGESAEFLNSPVEPLPTDTAYVFDFQGAPLVIYATGSVASADLDIIRQNWNLGSTSGSVPEPTVPGLLLLTGLVGAMRRYRNR